MRFKINCDNNLVEICIQKYFSQNPVVRISKGAIKLI